jgi:hypothetical protein
MVIDRRLLFLPLLFAGCSEELGPEQFLTTPLAGHILEDGRPVAGGWVEFIPVEGTKGNQRSARIQPDGSFQADRVAVGEVAIRLVNAPIRLPGGMQLFGSFQTPIRRVISEHPDSPLEIDLLKETLLYKVMQARAREGGKQKQGEAP